MSIGDRTKSIGNDYKQGMSILEIANKYGITELSVNKRLKKFQIEPKVRKTKNVKQQATWNIDSVQIGVSKFYQEYGRLPSATDFDRVNYLPSSRQIQRAYGGMSTLRKTLGYGDDISFTKGPLRADIAKRVNKRGVIFEEKIEVYLSEKFGEPFVHTQKRYNVGSKFRFDFFVYAKNLTFGVDVFSVDDYKNIEKNIRHKIKKYIYTNENLKVYFVVEGSFRKSELQPSVNLIHREQLDDRFELLDFDGFFKILKTVKALKMPNFIEII
jgi:transposase